MPIKMKMEKKIQNHLFVKKNQAVYVSIGLAAFI